MKLCYSSGRMSIKTLLIFFLFQIFVFIPPVSGQSDGKDTTGVMGYINKGVSFHDEGKYDEAIECYGRVSRCHPLYTRALYEIAFSLHESGRNKEALLKCNEAIELGYDIPQIFGLKGSILDDLGNAKEGAAVIGEAVKKWPYNQELLYNLAACLINNNDLLQGEKVLLKSIRVNPFHATTSLALAKINLMMGRTAESYLAYNMAILLSPRIRMLTQYEEAISGSMDSLIRPYLYPYPENMDAGKWQDLSAILQSGITSDKKIKYNYTPDYRIMRMSLLLFSNLRYDKNDTSIYNQYYVRFFTEMMETFDFEVFLNYSLSKTQIEEVQKWVIKNQDTYQEFIRWAQNGINKWKSHGFSGENESKGITVWHFNERDVLEAIGWQKETREGVWHLLEPSGSIADSGAMANDQKTGPWTVYWPDGKIKQKLHYKENKLNGACTTFHKNGAIYGIYEFREGSQYGKEDLYSPSGLLISRSHYRSDTMNGPVTQVNRDDWFTSEYTMKDGKPDGEFKEIWMNGKRKFIGNYNSGHKDGHYRFFYPNDTIESEIDFVNDTMQGNYRQYYRNGAKSAEGFYKKGKPEGILSYYDRYGHLKQLDSLYVNGELTGTRTYYFSTGGKKEICKFVRDTMVSVKQFDKTGKLIYEAGMNGNFLHYKDFYPEGSLLREGDFIGARMTGEWKKYTPSGVLLEILNYKDGYQTGSCKTFSINGQLKEEYVSDSNRIIGPYTEYFRNGKVYRKGQYVAEGPDGEWKVYYPNDSLSEEYYVSEGTPGGVMIDYSTDQHLQSEVYHNENGDDCRTIFFDHTGKQCYDWKYPFGESKAEVLYPDGKIWQRRTVRDNLMEGNLDKYYPNGQMSDSIPLCSGLVDGVVKKWDPEGIICDELVYVKGKRQGIWKNYADGKLASTSYFEENEVTGVSTDYYENGKISKVIEWDNGVRSGRSTYFSPDGNQMGMMLYNDNVLVGYAGSDATGKQEPVKQVNAQTSEVTLYYANGKPSIKTGLKNGLYNGRYNTWYPNGDIFREGTFVNDDEEGLYRIYYPGNILKEEINFHDGYRNGAYTCYYPIGKIRKRGNYILDMEHGEWAIYDQSGKQTATYYYDEGDIYEIRYY